MNDALELIFSRNAFYKRLHYLALVMFVFSVIILITFSIMIYYLVKNPTRPLYFVTDKVSRLIPIIPVQVPMKLEDVMAWAIEGVESAYSYDYINYRAQIQQSERYFTNYAWRTYLSTQQTGNIFSVRERRMIVSAKVVGEPKLLAQGILAGAYAWKLEMPLYVTYQLPPYDDKANFFSNALKVIVTVQRQPPFKGYQGLGFVQFIVEMP